MAETTTDTTDVSFLRALLRDLTHEIAAPLTPLFGHLDLLELRTADQLTPMQERCIRAMRRSLRRLCAINDRMLELARLERGHIPCEPAPMSPDEAAREALRRVREDALSHEIDLADTTAAAPQPQVVADWDLIQIALGHLLQNAIRHSPSGAVVRLEAAAQDDMYAFTVTDDGPGIPQTELDKLIRPFYRLVHQDDYTETAGLGLTIASLIARRLAGKLELAQHHPDRDADWGLVARLLVPLAP